MDSQREDRYPEETSVQAQEAAMKSFSVGGISVHGLFAKLQELALLLKVYSHD
jgi:hypothetical protein